MGDNRGKMKASQAEGFHSSHGDQLMMSAMSYTNKLILAPMVRAGTLPLRLLALDYGADIVFSEEIVDHKIVQCKRIENDVLGTVDFVTPQGCVVFRTCPKEKGKVVFQMGTASAERAVRGAKLIENDVAGIDVNMGCPKEFSIKGGMGAALLTQLDKVKEIVSNLVKAVSIPVTCKIRVLPTIEQTVAVVETIQSAGGAAITVHGRKRDERPKDRNRNEFISALADRARVPIIANGGSREIHTYADIDVFRRQTNTSSVMLARAAQTNPSIFRKSGLLPVRDVATEYMKYAVLYDNTVGNSKYCIQHMIQEKTLHQASTLRDMCEVFNLTSYYDDVQQTRSSNKRLASCDGNDGRIKRLKLEDGTEVFESTLGYNKHHFTANETPKMVLYRHALSQSLPIPQYHTEEIGVTRGYRTTLEFDGNHYRSLFQNKSKKWSEQSAALICVQILGLTTQQPAANLRNGANNKTLDESEISASVELNQT